MMKGHRAVLSEVSKHLERLRSAPQYLIFERLCCAAAIRGERLFPGTLLQPGLSDRELRMLEANLLRQLNATQEFRLEEGEFYVVFEMLAELPDETDVRLQSVFFSDLGPITLLMNKVECGFRTGMFDKNGEPKLGSN